jgi:penicillin V acylase-like amidase (Ntn superfamily)
MTKPLKTGLAALLALTITAPHVADACSRAVYFGLEGQTITGRTMDWFSPLGSNQWLYPRGLERDSNTDNPFVWTSKYGSVVTSIYEGGAADGMNEKGLVANLLYLAEAEYPPEAEGDTRPTLPVSAWVQYVLDQYATTAEAVEGLRAEPFRLVPVVAPSGEPGTLHLSISDASGDSAIFEYIDGKLVIHHSREYQVMTNSPRFEDQQALAAYWMKIGGQVMLPGTSRAADRFARLSYYINTAEQTADPRRAVATVFSIMRTVSVPIGINVPGQPNIADTLWYAVADQKNLVYYFQDTNSPGIIWTDLKALDFSEGSGPRKLQLDGNPDLAGNQTANFQPAELFKFLSPDAAHP